jgi:hypothetical protein
MTPIDIIKYIVDHLKGTPYEPWVNGLLFLLLAAAVMAAISLLAGRRGRAALTQASTVAVKSLKLDRKGYAPEWEAVRLRVEPYADFAGSLYMAFVGLYSATLVGLSAYLGYNKAPWWVVPLAVVWVLASFFYMRVNLEAASWAYHAIKVRRQG